MKKRGWCSRERAWPSPKVNEPGTPPNISGGAMWVTCAKATQVPEVFFTSTNAFIPKILGGN